MKRILPLLALLALTAATLPAQIPQYSFEQYLNIRSAWGGQIFPAGERVLFLSDITGVGQAYLVDGPGAWPQQISFFPDGCKGATVSRDGRFLFLAADAGGNERNQMYMTSPRGEAPRRVSYRDDAIYHFGGWSWDNTRFAYTSNERDSRFFDVYVYDLGWGPSHLVYQKNQSLNCLGWSPDDRWLVVSEEESNSNNNLYLVDVKTGEERLLTPHAGQALYQNVVWMPDARGFYLVSDQDREFAGLAYYDLNRGELEWIETPDWDVNEIALSQDGSLLAWTVNVDGYMQMTIRDLYTGGNLPAPPLPEGIISGFKFSRDNSRLIFNFNNPTHTTDVWMYRLHTGELTRVTESTLAGIDPATLVRPRLVHYPSFDGRLIPGFLYLPLGAQQGDSLAVVVKLHGGPESQAMPYLSVTTQYFLNRGLAVFEPNVRGSTGYGKVYTHLDDVAKRLDSVEDMEYAARWLVEQGYAHPRRLAVYGGSYGGYMVLAALTEQPDLWACGVDIVGIANFVTFLERTGPWRQANREAEYGSLERDRQFLVSISPLHKVNRIKAPLMVVQGANDPRVPQHESDQIVQALKRRKVPVQYLLYEDEGHGLAKLSNRLDAYPKVADFLLQHLGKE
ncbi:MAG: S9 family peptidase [Candidatus Zixiibacteriota bacterium]|nr:MAG: S9 family peptidase [candidate division Zixibacteria bacterium]